MQFKNDCHAPLFKILHEFETRKIGLKKDHGEIDRNIRRSCYREALFLLIAAVGMCLEYLPKFTSGALHPTLKGGANPTLTQP